MSAAVLLGLLGTGCGSPTQDEASVGSSNPETVATTSVPETSTSDGIEHQAEEFAEDEISEDLTHDEKAILVIDGMLTDEAPKETDCHLFFAFFDIGGEEMAVQSLVTSL